MYKRFVAIVLLFSMMLNTTAVTAFANTELPIQTELTQQKQQPEQPEQQPKQQESSREVSATPSDAGRGDDSKLEITESAEKATPSDAQGGLGAIYSGLTPGRVRSSLTSLLRGTLPSSYSTKNIYYSKFPAVRNQGGGRCLLGVFCNCPSGDQCCDEWIQS